MRTGQGDLQMASQVGRSGRGQPQPSLILSSLKNLAGSPLDEAEADRLALNKQLKTHNLWRAPCRIRSQDQEDLVARLLRTPGGRPRPLARFFNVTGLTATTIRAAASAPGFTASILDYVLEDEPLLRVFAAEEAEIAPGELLRARVGLERSKGRCASGRAEAGRAARGVQLGAAIWGGMMQLQGHGDRGRARTCTPQLRRLMLHPVERRGLTRKAT